MNDLAEKEESLRTILSSVAKGLIAYSGGIDSAFLLWFAHTQFPGKFLGVIADSPSLKRSELQNALAFAETHRLPARVIHTREIDNSDYANNPLNRCYFCKFELFEQMNALACLEGYSAICYGENTDDAHDVRHGKKAASEFRVLAPLHDAGFAKADVRRFAREAGLEIAEKPAQPCLSSRIPHGSEVTPEKLREIELAESVIEKAGFRIVRVRHLGKRALVQVAPGEVSWLQQLNRDNSITDQLKKIGFEEVELDPVGYEGASLR
ncbi:MAG: ATP-dependent sacrificial sulfur transferase LarE [Methylacidiphilales bacterium]|nr:ATP-dependent sacrificial sulfur transferase LarE [Candidatus Methylacidiphilales bacterium]